MQGEAVLPLAFLRSNPELEVDSLTRRFSGNSAVTYKLRLLVTGAFGELSRMEQSLALDLARYAGMRAALLEDSRQRLEAPDPGRYLCAVVKPATDIGLIDAERLGKWERACNGGSAPEDPRVRSFLYGWRERAGELLSAMAQFTEEARANARNIGSTPGIGPA